MPSEKTINYVIVEKERTVNSEVRLELLKAVLEKKKPFRFTAHGFSMSPVIHNQDILTIEPLPPGSPALGDVVAFELPDIRKLTVHRVVKSENTAYLIKGDNMTEPDGMVSRADILGIVTRVERNGSIISAGLGRERPLIAILSRYGLLRGSFRLIRFPFDIGAAGLKRIEVLASHSRENSGSQPDHPPKP